MDLSGSQPKPVVRGPITWADFCGIKAMLQEDFEEFHSQKTGMEVYDFKKAGISFSVRFGAEIGNFFEISRSFGKSEDEAGLGCLESYIEKLCLMSWTNETYLRLLSLAKRNAIGNNSVESKNNIIRNKGGETISKRLARLDNDYTSLERRYYTKYSSNLLSKNLIDKEFKINLKVSVVIPSYNSSLTLLATLKTLNDQALLKDEFELLEVIVVDDGSDDDTEIKVENEKYNFNFKYLKQNNFGRAASRNMGVAISTGEILIFLDSDVLLDKNFIREHALRSQEIEKGVFISFRENINIDNDKIVEFAEKEIKPTIEKDFRFSKEVTSNWSRIHRLNIPVEQRIVKLVEESDSFKSFGKGKILGAWDLPCMFLTVAVSLRKNEFLKCGGISLKFKGWGMEDTFLGTCLISRRNFFIPVFSTGLFHIRHKSRSDDEEQQTAEFEKNVIIYNDFLDKRIEDVVWKPYE